MAIAKKRKIAAGKVDKNKTYTLKDASSLVKEVNTTKFDASVDLHIRLGVDPKKADQSVRGTVSLPHGTGKTKRVLYFAHPIKKRLRELPARIMWAWMNSFRKSKVDGWMWMWLLPPPLLCQKLVSWVKCSARVT